MSLYSIFLNNTGKSIKKPVHYFPVYERHFSPFVGRPILFVEIGTGRGGSAQMWKKYFGPLARIVSLDKSPRCKEHEDYQVSVRTGSQSDEEFLGAVIDEFGAPDIVADDGSHQMSDLRRTFDFLYPRLTRGGIYFVQDLHTAYREEYGGGLRREGTFIEFAKDCVDVINISDTGRVNVGDIGGDPIMTEIAKNTLSVHFYSSIVVFERGSYVSRKGMVVGDRR